MTKPVEITAAALDTTKSRQSNISFEKHSLFILEQLEEFVEASSEDEPIVNEHYINDKKRNISTDASIASPRPEEPSRRRCIDASSIHFDGTSERALTAGRRIECQDSSLSSTVPESTPSEQNDKGCERSKASSSVTMHSWSLSSLSSSSVIRRIQDDIIAKGIADGKIASAPTSLELVLGSDGSWSTCSSRRITFKRC